jgi:hypothetical protein
MFIHCIMNVGNASADNNNNAFTLGVRDSRVESPNTMLVKSFRTYTKLIMVHSHLMLSPC